MADFGAPSFSLGLDLEAPSFSLGLDLDFDSEPHLPPTNPAPNSSTDGGLENEEVVDSDPDLGPEPPRILKRLRRGPGTTVPSSSASAVERVSEDWHCNRPDGDDDIEDFSSQEGFIGDEHPLTQHNSVCSSSKAPWHQRGVLMTKSSNESKARKEKQVSHSNDSASIGTMNNTSVFPKLRRSPLRRFQLIDSDSDSDDPCVGMDLNGKPHKVDASSKARQSNSGRSGIFVELSKEDASVSVQNKDLWKDFCPMNSRIPTPAFDEVCEEYFHSVKDKNSQKLGGILPTGFEEGLSSRIDGQFKDPNSPLPPAHYYFFHDDRRIQKLVRNRLPNFSPLGIADGEGSRQLGAPVVDYMCQFSKGETSKKPAAQDSNLEGSSTRRKKSKVSNAKETSQGWVNPKHTAGSPKDAGKRRVQADGQSSGHWYSRPDGKRVYVTKNGQELTGQIAYRHYKRESGTRFKSSKKKTSTKTKKRTR